ncbi:hypothetical protein F9L33_04725 [Amylibacter sp. SFDW26]|uniref:DUF7742 family protein n=1 Tax=Amylibacter sp. SFDW26 TaxID=2652722 RepID=UPI0012619982|nr:hypothetical protein [Amylibacter sp. SFDW26]KAB7616069.1 hypothetical protein F9L33_04725 [Amylibacter sp. SFDW26]
MRALLHVDVVTAARALLVVPDRERVALCDQLFDRAHAADKYRKRFGRYLRGYGSGSLASACWDRALMPEPFLSDKGYAKCMRLIFERVLRGFPTSRVRR